MLEKRGQKAVVDRVAAAVLGREEGSDGGGSGGGGLLEGCLPSSCQ